MCSNPQIESISLQKCIFGLLRASDNADLTPVKIFPKHIETIRHHETTQAMYSFFSIFAESLKLVFVSRRYLLSTRFVC